MRNLSLQENEQEIVATIICCSKQLKIDNKPMIKLYESIIGFSNENNNIDSEIIENNNKVKFSDFRNNKLAYFNNVNKFLNESENNIINNLNENFNDDSVNIEYFKKELNKNISELLKNNDFNKLDTLDSNILKIKIFANKPIFVYGFDIMNNYHLQEELKNTYNLNIVDIISIIFDKTNKQLLFVFENNLIVYVLETNSFGYYNNIYENQKINESITKTNYLDIIKNEINANIIEIFINRTKLEFTFKDNLFQDKKRTEEIAGKSQYRNNNLFVKSTDTIK
jgi:hypothetical protein